MAQAELCEGPRTETRGATQGRTEGIGRGVLGP